MNQNIFKEIRDLRNQIAHGGRNLDYKDMADRLTSLGISVSPSELPELIPTLLQVFVPYGEQYFVPQVVFQVMTDLLVGQPTKYVCDPWAGFGSVISSIKDISQVDKALAITLNPTEAKLGKAFVKNAEWQVGDPLEILGQQVPEIDVAASVLPINARSNRPLLLTTPSGDSIKLQDFLGNLILVAVSRKLKAGGIGLFIVSPTFFTSKRSVIHQFKTLQLGVEAALALPSGAFAPFTNAQCYLVVIRNYTIAQMFVAQLSNDVITNRQIVTNLKLSKEGGSLELGRYVNAEKFVGLDAIRTAERFKDSEQRLGAPAVRLRELATEINLGRPTADFLFVKRDNSIYVPLIGISNVSDSEEGLSLKIHNYAQVVIDPSRSHARFVAMFLNSEFGKEIREMGKAGFIPRLNKESLKGLPVLIPDLKTQQEMLDVEAKISVEQNTLLGLQNELRDYQRELWKNPKAVRAIDGRIKSLSNRLNMGLKQHAVEGLDQWFETLPFPLASILRAWQATQSQDFKAKQEHLLQFFEATAEFLSIIFLSAFSSRELLFDEHKEKIVKELKTQKLSFARSTFGVWKTVIEYLSKQTRQLLLKDKDSRGLCADIFADSSLVLPEMLSRKELLDVISDTNKKRNDWAGHSGVVSQTEAKRRNELLIGDLQKLREVMADGWRGIQLINAIHSQLRREIYENEIAILTGSNSEFLKEKRNMSVCLDVESLYLMRVDSAVALQLIPLVQVGPSPESANNACYFYNRLEKDGIRFVSYHFADKPEQKKAIEDATRIMKMLMEA